MEEKARLSREQEMQRHYKSQPPLELAPSAASMMSESVVSKSSVRDLSSSLLNTSMRLPSGGGGPSALPGSTSGVRWGSSTHRTGVAQSQSWAGQPPQANTRPSTPARTVDMSALDNIMPMGSKTRPTLNSMVQPVPVASGPNPFGTSLSMMGPPRGSMPAGYGQNSVMMPGVSGQMAAGAPFGGVRPMMPGNSGIMGGKPLLMPQQPGIPQSISQHSSTNAATSLSNKDIADLLG